MPNVYDNLTKENAMNELKPWLTDSNSRKINIRFDGKYYTTILTDPEDTLETKAETIEASVFKAMYLWEKKDKSDDLPF